MTLILAGLESVTDALSMAMERLASAPEQRREPVADPSMWPAAVEELLRLGPPAPFLPRFTTENTEIAGCPVAAGTLVHAHLSTADRDEAVWPQPHAIDFHRHDNPHTSLGVGVHRCLGAHLAGLETHVLFEEWHRLIPDFEIVGGASHRVRLVRANIGLESLYLRFPGTAGDS